MAFKPKKQVEDDDFDDEEYDDDPDEEEVEETEKIKQEVKKKPIPQQAQPLKAASNPNGQITIQEIVDIIEGHLQRANQLLVYLKQP